MNESVRSQLELSVSLTPSGDNCQPFTCSWKGEQLVIHHDDKRASHLLNYGDHASLLALGCLLENVRVMALAHGLQSSETLGEDPLKDCVISFRPVAVDETYREALKLRCTDRRVFEKGWSDDLKSLESETVKLCSTLPSNVRAFFLQCDGIFWDDPGIFFDILKWVRFSKKEALRTRDGLPTNNLGLSFTDKLGLWFASRAKICQRIMAYGGGKILGRMLFARQLDSSAGFVFVYPRSSSKESLVRAGQEGMRLWLELTRRNFGVQPLTMGTLMTFSASHYGLSPEYQKSVRSLLQGGVTIMEKELGLPVWGFRFGRTFSPLSPDQRTLRRFMMSGMNDRL